MVQNCCCSNMYLMVMKDEGIVNTVRLVSGEHITPSVHPHYDIDSVLTRVLINVANNFATMWPFLLSDRI